MKRLLCAGIALLILLLCCAATAEDAPKGFTLTPIEWDGAGLGKAAVPEGYELLTEVHCSDEMTCLGAPLRLSVMVASQEERAVMIYSASESYIDRVKSGSSILKHEDGELDKQTMIFMLRYQNADEYCDTRAGMINSSVAFYRAEDMSFFQSRLETHQQYFSGLILPGLEQFGIHADWLEVTAAQRVYTYEAEGETWAFCIMAETRGYQYTLPGVGDVCALWDVPGYYALICPLADYQRLHDSVFTVFVENTAVSDTFLRLQDDLTFQIRDETIQAWSMQVAASNAYAAAMNALTSASVNSYLQASSYSSVDRFTDYIFDQHTYTTSDGYEVSISTSYDYVWEGDYGTVYYSTSAFDMPYGATQLYPSR